jgi:predicted AAA+ superfamily ATPase
VVLLTGARQVGKTTLARDFVDPKSINYFDLEDPTDLARLDAPMAALEGLEGIVVIDEVQHRPELFPAIRVLSDRRPLPARFLILGSAAPQALRQASESLTGRIEMIELAGLSIEEVGPKRLDTLWMRGGFPESFLARDDEDSFVWRTQYVRNLANRDLPDFGMGLGPAAIERFLGVTANYHGQLWNSAALARAIDLAESTSRRYIDALADALLVRVLRPWSANLGKRLTKTPKVYFRDSGLLHALLGIEQSTALLRHPLVGASWEGFVIEEALKATRGVATPYYWRTSHGAEIDLLLETASKRVGVEVKRTDAPTLTRSMRSALDELELDRMIVVYPGSKRFKMAERLEAVPLSALPEALGEIV